MVAYPAAGVAPTDADFIHVFTETRSRFTIVTPEDIADATEGYVKACYVNTRGEAGPFSEIAPFVVA